MTIKCPECGEEGVLTVLCTKQDDEVQAKCGSCDAEFTLQELRDYSANLVKLVEWIETAPFLKG